VPDGLPKIDPAWIEQFILPTDGPDTIILNTYLGRGPLAHAVEASAMIFFDHGEETYPVFEIPSEGPRGAALRGTTLNDHIELPEGAVAFVVNVTMAKTVTLSSWDAAANNRIDGGLLSGIQATLGETKAVLNTIVGAYALYQYPLVWKRLHERHSYAFVDTETVATTRSFRPILADNFIPFRLNASPHVSDNGFVDPVHAVAASLVNAKVTEPFVFLKDSLWEDDIRTRFLLQFWIVEYFAEKHAATMPVDAAGRAFVEALEGLTAEHLPEHLAEFKKRKGELLRRTLAEKVRACCDALRIQYDDSVFKRAKKVRDNLSHGSAYIESDLMEMEQYIRELSRYILRRELESRGIFLEGTATPISQLPILTVPLVNAAQKEKQTGSFQLP